MDIQNIRWKIVALSLVSWSCDAEPVDLDAEDPTLEAQLDEDVDLRASQAALEDQQGSLRGNACYVQVVCDNGSSKSCSGNEGQCSASNIGTGRVTCNGTTYNCPTIQPPPDECWQHQHEWCTSSSQCGWDGACVRNRCVCL